MKYILCVILIYILICPGYVLAVRAPSSFDAQGNPVYEDETVNPVIEIDNTQKSVRFPPALSNYHLERKNTNLPEDIQGFDNVNPGSTGSGNGSSNNTGGNSQDLPDELKGFETGGTGQNSTGTNVDATPVASSGNNMSVSTTGVSTTAGMHETKTDNTITVLWFIMACLIVALMITVLYMVNIKKDKSSSTENF